MEKEHLAIQFVNAYLGYNADTVAYNWAQALSLMTDNLKQTVLARMQKDNAVGTVQDNHVSSAVVVTSIHVDPTDPLVWHVYAVRTVSTLAGSTETLQKFTEAYTVRLVEGIRSINDPNGLMVAEFHSQQISVENDTPEPKQ